jgi:hypothetical protein
MTLRKPAAPLGMRHSKHFIHGALEKLSKGLTDLGQETV